MPEATIALVTGASRGIGSATCLALARGGLTVAVGYRSDPEGAEETVAKARADGGIAVAVAMDVRDEASIEEAFRRIMDGRPTLKYYEAGLDLELADDPEESFRRYQGLIQHEYEAMVEEFGLVRMDAVDNLIRQQQHMRRLVEPHLAGVSKVEGASISEVLAQTSLRGRYLVNRAGDGSP